MLTSHADYSLGIPETPNAKYLLIMSCSKKKIREKNMEALHLYDGPAFHIVRASNPANTDIMILSAKYGLIFSDELISYYNRKMTSKRVKQLKQKNKATMERLLQDKEYKEIYVNLGKQYLESLPLSELNLNGANLVISKGMIGQRLHNLKTWLEMLPGPKSEE